MRDLEQGLEILMYAQLEHHRLRELVQAVKNMLSEIEFDANDRRGRRLVAARLQALRQELAGHFQLENEDGYLEEAVCRVPRLTRRVCYLREKHAPMLADLDQIIRDMDQGIEKDVHWRFDRFAHALWLLEAAENRVMAEAFGTSISGEEEV